MQVVKQLKSSTCKLLQLDESTDVSSAHNYWSTFVRYVYEKKFKEEFLLCRELETTTKAKMCSYLITFSIDKH